MRFESGSERDSHHELASVHWSDSDKKAKVSVDSSYSPNLIYKQADQLSKDKKKKHKSTVYTDHGPLLTLMKKQLLGDSKHLTTGTLGMLGNK